MIDHLSVLTGQIIIDPIGRIVDLFHDIPDHRIFHIQQKNTCFRCLSLVDIYIPAQGNDPLVPIGSILKQLLDMRCGKVYIFNGIFRIFVPFLCLHLHVFLFCRHRLRCDQISFGIIQRQALNLIGIGLIEQTELLREFPAGYIKLLDHVVVCPVYNLPDIQQVCI